MRLFLQNEIPGDHLLQGIRSQGIGAGEVHDSEEMAVGPEFPFLLFHGDPGPVAHLLAGTGKGIKEGGLSGIGVSGQGYDDFGHFSTRTLAASSCRRAT